MHRENYGAGALMVFVVIVAVSVLAASPRTASAREPGAGEIRVTIEKIHYEGSDRYALVVVLENASSRDVLVRPLKEGFFVQQERGWASVNTMDNGKIRDSAGIHLFAGGKTERVASIDIPLTLPDLFRTYEGDLSLMFKYTYDVRTSNGSGSTFQKADEVYCWIKPGTSVWILREGM